MERGSFALATGIHLEVEVQLYIDPTIAIAYLLSINTVTFTVFVLDKILAFRNRGRISELTLLSLAGLGGSIGAIFGRVIANHKTKKQPFGSRLNAVFALQSVAIATIGAMQFNLF